MIVSGAEALQEYLVNEVQQVYRSQRVDIDDKHIEIIISQMLRKVKVETMGDTGLLPGSVIDKFAFREVNDRLRECVKIKDPGDSKFEENKIISKDAYEEERLHGYGREFLANRNEAGCSRHAVNETDSKKRERARRAAEQEIFQARFSRAHIGFVERGHDVKRQAGEFEADEDHEQLFAANEQHQSDRREQNEREILTVISRRTIAARKEYGEKGERDTDDFEQRIQRRDHRQEQGPEG